MRKYVGIILLACVFLFSAMPVAASEASTTADKETAAITQPLYKPLIERYILDELKLLRIDQKQLEVLVAEKVAEAKLESSDRALRYTADTTTNIFYIITAAATILVLLGWKSIKDMRTSMEDQTNQKISVLVAEYEERLGGIEEKMKRRSEQILANQEQIALTNNIHALWMRAGLEKNDQEKINIYDQILELRPGDVEALTYKADTMLELGEKKWALSLANQALDNDNEYSLAYWQRACAKAEIGLIEEAIDDLETAIQLSETLREDIAEEKSFSNLQDNERFQKISMAETNS